MNLAISRFQTWEMKEIFSSGKRFLLKHREKMKKTKLESCFFSKIWKEISLKNISKEKIFFFFEDIFLNLAPDFGKPQKFHDFVFVSTGF